MAQEVLTHLKEHPDAWTRVDTILEFSQNMNTKVSKTTFIYLAFIFLPLMNFEEGISFLAIDSWFKPRFHCLILKGGFKQKLQMDKIFNSPFMFTRVFLLFKKEEKENKEELNWK